MEDTVGGESMKVAITHWSIGEPPGGASQRIRGDVKGFVEAGHDVDLYYHDELQRLEERMEDYDLVSTPYLFADQYHDLDAYEDTHHHLQIGGFGNTRKDPNLIKQTVESADSVSVLDPNPALFYADQIDLDLQETTLIPNPPNKELFEPQPWDATDAYIFTPKIGAYHKTGQILQYVAAGNPTHVFEAHVKHIEIVNQYVERWPMNVHLKPPVPFSFMPMRYMGSELVLNAAERETLPNVAYEAMMSGRPYVSTEDAAAFIQKIQDLDSDDFGSSVDWFLGEHPDHTDPNHLVSVEDTERLDMVVGELMDNRDRRKRLGERGVEWVSDVFGEWGWREKAELIVEQAE